MDLGLLVELGLRGQPYTLPVFALGAVLLLGWRAATWSRRRRTWPLELLWWLAVLGYAAVTMTPTGTLGSVPLDATRSSIGWTGPGGLGLLSSNPEAVLNWWLLVPAGLFAGLVPVRRALRAVVTLALPFVAELGLQPFAFMGRAVTTTDLGNNLAGAVIGLLVGGLLAGLRTASDRPR